MPDGTEYTAGGATGGALSATFTDIADVTLETNAISTLVAADTTRREAIIVADPANTANIRVGGATVTAARGALLQPGGSIIVTSTAIIHGWAVPASQKVSVSLVKD
jgi:hypothetical protein